MKRARVGFALAALLAVPACARADNIEILSPRGAHCTLHREGQLLGAAVVPPAEAGMDKELGISAPLYVDSNASHGDIVVACTSGDAAISRTVHYGRMVGDWVGPLCLAGHEADCRSGGPTIDWGYPELVRMFFDNRPPSPAFPQLVTYSLGGAMSGPYRVTVDLELERVAEAMPSAGIHGDDAGVRTADLPVTASRALPYAWEQRIRDMAAAVLKRGEAETSPCTPSADALGRLDIVAGGENHPFEFSMTCMSRETKSLVDAVLCSARTNQPACLKP